MEISKESNNLELHSFPTRNKNFSEIQEYHEISENVVKEISTKSILSKNSTLKLPSDYDFFIKINTKTESKKRGKEKKVQKQKSNLIDVINAEIESSKVPITDTIRIKTDYSVELQKRYLLKSNLRNIFESSCPPKCFR